MTPTSALGLSILLVAALALYRVWKSITGRMGGRRERLVAIAREMLGTLDALNRRNNHSRCERSRRNPQLLCPMQNEDQIALSDLRSLQIWNLQDEILRLLHEVREGPLHRLEEVRNALERAAAMSRNLAAQFERSETVQPAHREDDVRPHGFEQRLRAQPLVCAHLES